MESDPHRLIEGLLIGAYATGATLRLDLHPRRISARHRARADARSTSAASAGILGDDALGTGVKFDAEVVRGAGSYVCGDETGLISSVNDERGMPRLSRRSRPQSGVLGKPTNVNNVETYAAVTTLLRLDAEKYSTVGTEVNRGTKMFTVSGDSRTRAASRCRSARRYATCSTLPAAWPADGP